jgi:uncharacterized protein
VERLFHIETDRVSLSFHALGEAPERESRSLETGLLRIDALRPSLTFGPGTFRASVPLEIAHDPTLQQGPLLFEQVNYKLYARARPGSTVQIEQEDPLFGHHLTVEDSGGTVHGVVNFGSQIGLTEFTVKVDHAPELRVGLEVFPSKLDYRADYEAILADVQEILTGLALEYLRSTYQLGHRAPSASPTELEWILLLRGVVDTLERALYHVARYPVWRLSRRPTHVRADRVRRVDAAVRSSIRRGRGAGRLDPLPSGHAVRQWLPETRPTPTLDTPEHRWLAAQVTQIRRRVAQIRRATDVDGAGSRRRKALQDLEHIEARLAALSRLEPLARARGEPPAGFASLPLLRTPGYREAYRACIVLSLGLRIEGGPLRLSVKDLAVLYEYWCYLATIRLLGEITGERADLEDLFTIRRAGIEVRLTQGSESKVSFAGHGDRRILLRYNPLVDHPDTLIPQQPDLLLSIVDPGWPPLELVLDAKYRLDTSSSYRSRYGTPGPPEDALNALHRYRDAILEQRSAPRAAPKRRVVQAAAAFPHRDGPGEDFAGSRLFRGLEKVGIGAVPLLPGSTEYLEHWLRSALSRGAWALADRAIDHTSSQKAADWKRAATDAVLIGVLRSPPGPRAKPEEAYAEAHFRWIEQERLYYTPLTKRQRRQFVARWLGIYWPAIGGEPGGVTHVAKIESFEVRRRCEVPTPWEPSRSGDEQVILYHLGPVTKAPRVIANRDDEGRGRRVPMRLWSSRLALERASVLAELALETEPEWRFYEDLRAAGVAFRVEAGPVRLSDPVNPRGRAWFRGEAGWSARYAGASGFEWFRAGSDQKRYRARREDVTNALIAAYPPER